MWLAPSAHMATMDDVECVGARYGRQTSYLMKTGACEPLWWLYHSSKATVRKLEAVACSLEGKAHMLVSVAHRSNLVTRPPRRTSHETLKVPGRAYHYCVAPSAQELPKGNKRLHVTSSANCEHRNTQWSVRCHAGSCGSRGRSIVGGSSSTPPQASHDAVACASTARSVSLASCRQRHTSCPVSDTALPSNRSENAKTHKLFPTAQKQASTGTFRDRQLRCEHEMMRWLRQ